MPPIRQVKVTLVALIALILIFLVVDIWMISPYLMAILTGGILATLLRPVHVRLQKRGISERWSAFLVVLGLIVLILGPLIYFATTAIHQGIDLGERLAQRDGFDLKSVFHQVSQWDWVQRLVGNPEELQTRLQTQMRNLGVKATTILLGLISSLPDRALQSFIGLITCYFLIVDGPRFVSWINRRLPMERDVRNHVYKAFRDTAISTLLATVAAGLIQAVILFIAYLTLGVPGAFLAAGATFILSWIPILGSTPVWIGGAIYLWFASGAPKAIAMVAFGILCSISDNLIRPIVLKGRSDMHPLLALIAIFGGIQLFGLFGVFFGPILFSVLLSLLEAWPSVALRYGLASEETLETSSQKKTA